MYKIKEIINKVHCSDCVKFMQQMPSNSIDSLICDPPYGISFMGKKWDYDVPQVEVWKECLRVLKPGGHALVACGTRTQHRMAVNLEDSGFEIRDIVAWVYGCLSKDTEILTEKGFKPSHKTKPNGRIMVYDIQTDSYKWEKPKAWQMYNIKQDTAYRIQSDYTDQIVSRNHNCIVEREGRLVFIQAEELASMEIMPYLPSGVSDLQKICGELLFVSLFWKSKRLAEKLFSKWARKEMPSKRIKDGKEPSMEGGSNILEKKGELQTDKVCAMSERVSGDGEEGQLYNGTPTNHGSTSKPNIDKDGSNTPHQSRPARQSDRKSDAISNQQGTQTVRRTRAKITPIEYTGLIYCPTVSTSAFVARRNGKVFITGNSGFPKSHNIGKAVNKLQGNEREVVGKSNRHNSIAQSDIINPQGEGGIPDLTKGSSPYEGWGTALKPAMELWTLCRKPLEEKTIASNVLKHGTGGINIDGCRVGSETVGARKRTQTESGETNMLGCNANKDFEGVQSQGRFPANLIHDGSEEVVSQFPDTKASKVRTGKVGGQNGLYENGHKPDHIGQWPGGEGSASRFFYCAKASKAERNAGLEGLEDKPDKKWNGADGHKGIGDKKPDGTSRAETKHKNNHPTVKPIKLMQYLCRLITPKGGIVLDPFTGSGSTLIGAKMEGFNYIGIELDKEYCKIAEARLKQVQSKLI